MIAPVLPDEPLRQLSRAAARAMLALLLAVMAWSALAVPKMVLVDQQAQATKSEDSIGDFALYKLIAGRVEAGEPYYQAALTEQRAHDYPTRPFVTVRLPTLAWGHGALGQTGMRIAVSLLMLAVIGLFVWRFAGTLHRYEVAAGALTLVLGGAAVFNDLAAHSHDLVSGILLSLALLAYYPDRWWPSLALAGLALAVRELALPFVLLWLGFAALQGRWREFLAISVLLLLYGGALYFHAQAIAALVLPGDKPSPGWSGLASLAIAQPDQADVSARPAKIAGWGAGRPATARLVVTWRTHWPVCFLVVCRVHACHVAVCAGGEFLLDHADRAGLSCGPGIHTACYCPLAWRRISFQRKPILTIVCQGSPLF